MDDTLPPQSPSPAEGVKPRRRGLHVPLQAVVVGLGLASGPAMAQTIIIARDDTFNARAGAWVNLPVLANDTLSNTATFFTGPIPTPSHGTAVVGANVISYVSDPDFSGVDNFLYCIGSAGPFPPDCANVTVFVRESGGAPVPALGGLPLVALSGALGWLAVRLRRRR